jgi:hypothetical protein
VDTATDAALTLPVSVVHSSPGRVRLRVRREDLNAPALLHAEQAIIALPGVFGVRKNSLARSVVVSFDPGAIGLDDLLDAVTRVGIAIEPLVESPAMRLPDHPLDESITEVFRSADERVRERTRGKADLRTLVPVGLAVLAARELLAGRLAAAPWYVLLWYSFSSFVSLRKSEASSDRLVG